MAMMLRTLNCLKLQLLNNNKCNILSSRENINNIPCWSVDATSALLSILYPKYYAIWTLKMPKFAEKHFGLALDSGYEQTFVINMSIGCLIDMNYPLLYYFLWFTSHKLAHSECLVWITVSHRVPID